VESRQRVKPWKGKLPPPRVSPPRTFGDALRSATHFVSPAKNFSGPSWMANTRTRNSSLLVTTNGENPGFGAGSSFAKETTEPFPALTAQASMPKSINPCLKYLGCDKVCIGPNKWFRPTKGLAIFHSRTGTRISNPRRGSNLGSRTYAAVVRSSSSPSRRQESSPSLRAAGARAHAQVVRDGERMAMQGGRGTFNLGFRPSFNQGAGDRGGFHQRRNGYG